MMKMKKNKSKLFYTNLFFSLIILFTTFNFKFLFANEVSLPNFGFICEEIIEKKSKFEFIFSRNANDTEDIVFRRIDGKFQYIGDVLAKKSGSYVLWEDKIFFRTSDFAWKLDKVTSIITPIMLSVGNKLESFDKIPNEMTCNSRSIYY